MSVKVWRNGAVVTENDPPVDVVTEDDFLEARRQAKTHDAVKSLQILIAIDQGKKSRNEPTILDDATHKSIEDSTLAIQAFNGPDWQQGIAMIDAAVATAETIIASIKG
tara:strand:- start:53 stop:379 length:327 start_codon:yes stop_codon:yes gene_type:complete